MQGQSLSSSQQIIQALRNARQQIEDLEKRQREPIAIIGIGCRFPGPAGAASDSPDAFWTMLRDGIDGVIEMPPHHHDPAANSGVNLGAPKVFGGFLPQVDHFDPQFFGIAPREAAFIDPQQRLLLEVCWEALEAAQIVPETLFDSDTGVFVGLCQTDYAKLCMEPGIIAATDLFHANVGTIMSTAAGRLSYTFGFTGPAVVVDTACSSSLVAIHQACQSLRNSECTVALAGGVNLILLTDWASYPNADAEQQYIYAPDGRCKTFDAAADGFGRGEGCGMVVLKTLSAAEADGDPILAVIRGSMVNQDGRSSGLTAPSGPAQQKVIRHALQNAGVEPDEVSYIEAHGTGTILGDPIEIGALNAVFGKRTTPLWVGSVKTNLGHLEGAAGVAGLIKIVLSFRHQQLPPHLNLRQPNPLIDWARSPVQVPLQPQPWTVAPLAAETSAPRIAGLSSFGISGTNAHIVLAEAPVSEGETRDTRQEGGARSHHLLTIAAKSGAALQAYAERYSEFLEAHPTYSLGDLCYSSQVTRSHFAHRLTITAASLAELQAQLALIAQKGVDGLLGGAISTGVVALHKRPPAVAFLFTGQGAQYGAMGRELYETQPLFRATLDQCDALLRESLGESLLEVLYPEIRDTRPEGTRETRDTNHASRITYHASRIDQTTYTQPALFVLEYALAMLWQSWGVQPEILIGHSVGEIAAACVAGVFSLADGLKLVAARGRLMGALPQDGAMVSLLADATSAGFEARVLAAIAPHQGEVDIAAINGPDSIVISGKRETVLAIAEKLAAEGVKTRPLTVSHAFHSPLMDPMLDPFRQVAANITYHPPKVRLVSNVTGKVAGAEVATPDYWVRHVRAAVRFADGIQTLHEQQISIFLEIGPKPVLLGIAGSIQDKMTRWQDDKITHAPEDHPVILSSSHPVMLPSLREGQPAWQQMLVALGELYVRGVRVNWQGLHQDDGGRKVTLPTYPFQRQRYWIGSSAAAQNGAGAQNDLTRGLSATNLAAITDRMIDSGAFAPDDRTLITRVLTALDAANQAQQAQGAIAEMLYTVAWEPQSTELTLHPPTTPGRWLILADQQGVGAALAAQLQQLGETVDCVSAATDLTTVTADLAAQLPSLRGVVHLWGMDERGVTDAADLLHSQEKLLDSMLALTQTMAQAGGNADPSAVMPRLWIVTQGAQTVDSTEAVAVAQTSLWGLGRVVALEHGELWGGLLDIDDAADLTATAHMLLAELLQGDPVPQATQETQVAYRKGVRYLARLVRGQLPLDQQPSPTLPIQPDGLYLVTGGLGALGLLVADWLAAQGATHLLLTGRRGITTAAQQETIDRLTAQGVIVQLAQVDVADEVALRALFAQIADSPLLLKGVFHTAGILDDALLLNQRWARFAPVLAPKVTGSWLLHELTQGLALDYMVFFSSGVALLGNRGQGNYAAANAFMDGLAAYRRHQGLPALSINWGAWAQSGMAARTTKLALADHQLIAPAVGLTALAQLLAGQAVVPYSQMAVMPIDWGALAAVSDVIQPFFANFITPAAAAPAPAQPSGQGVLLHEVAATAVDRRLVHVRDQLQQAVRTILGMSDLPSRTTGFADLGMDSLMALELRRYLEHSLDCKLPTTIAFEYPTVDDLAACLLDLIQARLADATNAPLAVPGNGQIQYRTIGLDEPIAVISMACRFPGADTPEAFWQLLAAGVDMVQEVPPSRWDVDEFYDPQRPAPGKMYMRAGAFIDDVEQFDPLFFGIAPREALGMDPQHRLLLETSWEALERAGLVQQRLIDSQTGVFVGLGPGEYGALGGFGTLAEMDSHAATSSGHSIAAGRLAYTLGLQGPAIAVDTACSSSLVALHLACQSLRGGECDLALAGGVNLILSPFPHIALSQMQALSPDGRCKTFDATADGYGRGEGGAMVLLKRRSDAERDGDTILAVIKGSAVNHNGPSSGLTVPNKRAQEKLLHQALAAAQVTPAEISYVEAHGTGTPLGDPIELRALGAVYGVDRANPLLVGSVKTNVGHLEAAAGIVGFVKLVLALQHRQLPPHLHFQTPNPLIEWETLAIHVPTTLQPWQAPTADTPLLAGISSFGISGTNAHLILAEGRQGDTRHETLVLSQAEGRRQAEGETGRTTRPLHVLTLAGKSEEAVVELAARYRTYLQNQPEIDLSDLCYTAATARNQFNHRLAIIAATPAELATKLLALQQQAERSDLLCGTVGQHPPRVAFLFTGQGSQYVGMGRELYATEPTFRAILDQCDALLRDQLGESLLSVLYPETRDTNYELRITNYASRITHHASPITLDDTTYTQPALFVLEYALAKLWQSWGVQPDLLIGHSVGELVAACVAGVFSLADALTLVAARGRLMGALPQIGTMVSLMADEAEVQAALLPYQNDVSIAAVNGPTSVVISGERNAVLAIADQLAAQGIKGRELTVSHAFHSGLMEPMLDAFRAVAESITYQPPTRPLVSNLTGKVAGAEVLSADYWVRHVREAVRFADGVATLQAEGIDIFLEIGPKPTLLGLVEPILDKLIDKQNDHPVSGSAGQLVLLPSLREGQNDWQPLLRSLGELYVRGMAVDWTSFDQAYERRRVLLPTYAFQRQRYWLEAKPHRPHDATQSDFAEWLATHNIEELTDRIFARLADDGDAITADRATVAQVLTSLAAEGQAQALDAQLAAMLYALDWERGQKSLPLLPPKTPGHWLLLGDAQGIGTAVAAQLTALGETIEIITSAAELAAWTDQLRTLAESAPPLRGILHLWALDGDLSNLDQLSPATLMQTQARNLDSVVQLVQTLSSYGANKPGANNRGIPARLWVVTQGAQQLGSSETVAVDQTPLWGLGRVVALEHGELWGGLIDLAPDQNEPSAAAMTAQLLLAEILQPAPTGETQVAYRQGKRHVARLVQGKHSKHGQRPVTIQPNARYLITGGLGALGLVVAAWLAEQGATNLILTGRSGITTEAQQAAIAALAAQGVTVEIAQIDVADEAAMRALFARIGAGALPLKGVFHTAGVLDDAILLNQHPDRFATVLAAKVTGGWLLHQLTQTLDLDLLVFFSSATSLLGNMGQANYGAANAFLDGLARYRQQQGLPGLSINWGAWAAAGMAARTGKLGLDERQLISPTIGRLALTQLLGRDGQIGVMAIDWGLFALAGVGNQPFLANFVTPASREKAAPNADQSALVQTIAALPPARRLEQLKLYLLEVVGTVLGIVDLKDRTAGFADLGMDSLMALELRRQLERSLHCTLPTTIAFEYPTVDALAAYLLDLLWGDAQRQPAAHSSPPALVHSAALDEPIAVISMACRFPGADSPEAFWQLLLAGTDMVQPIPDDRWPVDAFYDPQRPTPGKMYMRAAAFLDQVAGFDPLFFGISPREAVGIDPQHRLLLETSWEALERAGLAPNTLIESQTGVFVGIGAGDYGVMTGVQSLTDLDSHMATGGGHSVAAGRLAYTLGLQGPTLAVDTACSSSLVSLHLACQSLRTGECDLALAGGVNLMLTPFTHIALSQMGALSADGRCKTFDAAADGYGRGEGCGMVLLKRLSAAERDGDPILAVIKGSAVNHDGPSSGLTVPNKRAQEKLLRQALAAAQVTPDAVSYVEAHGTGTSLGDPIEIRALGAVFGATRETPLLVGSVKTNVGHLEAAAGIAGFIKTVLALQYRQIPPHLHFTDPNPYIEWDEVAITVPTTVQPWPQQATPLIAGISSFGISGTNAHVIVAAPPQVDKETLVLSEAEGRRPGDNTTTRPAHLLPLSAKSEAALAALAKRYSAHLQAHPALDLGDLCYTAALGRNHFNQRLAIVATDQAELLTKLALVDQGERGPGLLRGDTRTGAQTVAFLFTGQGSQYMGMGRELYATQPHFRAALDECDQLLRAALGESLLTVLYGETRDTRHEIRAQRAPARHETRDTHHASRITLDDTTYTQPALFALEYALATMWQAWGIQPDLLIGHSVGEIAAACVAGVFTLADAVKLVAARGRLMGALPADGAMISLLADSTGSSFEAQVQAAIALYASEVSIAAVNGPESVVISGRQETVLRIAEQLAAAGIKTHRLTVSHAFHSPLMEPMLDDFRQVAESITYHAPQVPLVSNVTGKVAGAEIATPAYWVHHVRAAVRFGDGVATLHEQGIDIFLEIGPQPVLLGLVGSAAARTDRQPLLLPSLRKNQPDWPQLLTSLGELYVRGVAINWGELDPAVPHHKVLLPTYAFQRQRYWLDALAAPSPQLGDSWGGGRRLRPLIDTMIQSPLIREILFETVISVETLPFLADHRVYETVVVPGACHLAMVLSAAELALQPQLNLPPNMSGVAGVTYQLSDVIFPQALALAAAETRIAQISLTPSTPLGGSVEGTGPQAGFHLISLTSAAGRAEGAPSTHATGTVLVTSAGLPTDHDLLATLQARYSVAQQTSATDPNAQEGALRFGPAFQWIDEIWCAPSAGTNAEAQALGVLAKLRRPAAVPSLDGYLLHPGLLDACFQVVGVAYQLAQTVGELLLPFAIERCQFHPATTPSANEDYWWCYVQPAAGTKWDIQLFDEMGQLIGQIDKFELRAAPQTAIQSAQIRTDWLYTLAWAATPLPTNGAPTALPDCWLLVGAMTGVDAALTQQLQATGCPLFTAPADDTVQQVVTTLATDHRSVGVVYLGGTAATPEMTVLGLTVPAQSYQLCVGLLQLTQALLATDLAVQLWVVTQDCQLISDERRADPARRAGEPFASAAMGALWGLGRTIAQEQPQLHTVCVDLDGDPDSGPVTAEHGAQQAALLYGELLVTPEATADGGQVAYRQQRRYVAHLAPWQTSPTIAETPLADTQPLRLQLQAYGSLDHLRFVPLTRRQPAVGEIEVEVKAVGLNFRDVLNALGMMKEYYAGVLGITQASDVGLGFECAGVVSAVGEGVTNFAVGDRVMGLATIEGAFASYLTLPAAQMTPIPTHLTDEEAATIPMAFLTAWYGLVELAQLQAGERVLIHAAAGGVGQAAVQIAHALGAEVIATASPGKWDFLRGQGVAHTLNSRSLAFAEEIMQITGGAGVDVVLNSLNGDFIDRSLGLLGPRGRFVEIGKLGIWSHAQMAQARPDVAYYPFDLGEAMSSDPTLYARLWAAVTGQLQARTLQPLPHTSFARQEMVAAFRYMQQAKQVGKIVVTMTPDAASGASPGAPVTMHDDAVYLITGGLGALGLHIAQQLVADGAKQLVLSGRQGVTSVAQQEVLTALAAAGAQVTIVQADVAEAAEARQLIDRCTALAVLRGIVHTAGVLDDGVLTAQTPARLAQVMRPKVQGSWQLHTLTAGLELDFFVCFSSVAALVGAPGQSNYAAANAFMDSLMQLRVQQGLPGLSINWGPWAGTAGLRGMAADLQARMQAQGLTMIAPLQGRLLFRYLLNQPVAQIGVLPLQRQQPVAPPSAAPIDLRQILADLAASVRPARLAAYLRGEIATVLGLRDETPIDPRTRLFDFGLDSLMAVELKNRLEAGLGATLRSTLLFDYPTLEALTAYLLHNVLKLGADDALENSQSPLADDAATAGGSALIESTTLALDELSDEDLIAFITKENQEFS